jgi:hypothetical protein
LRSAGEALHRDEILSPDYPQGSPGECDRNCSLEYFGVETAKTAEKVYAIPELIANRE